MFFAQGPYASSGWKSGELIRLEAAYNESITLTEVLERVLSYGLQLKIARQSFAFQRGQALAAAAGFLPSYSLSYSGTAVTVFPDTRTRSQLFVTQLRYPVFLGGAVLYGALGSLYRERAWKQSLSASANDALFNAFQKYSDLVLQNMLLDIRARAVKLSQANLQLNCANYRAGLATQFAVMQARAQLGSDQESLYKQQLQARQAALALNMLVNVPMLINLQPRVNSLKEESICDRSMTAVEHVNLALAKRPELRQYELFYLAARRSIQLQSASFYPGLSFFTAYTAAATHINDPANVNALNGVAATQVAQAQENMGVVSNRALGQTPSFSPGSEDTAQEGASTLANIVAGSGGNPIANVQGGALVTSGAVNPQFNSAALSGAPASSNIQGSNTAGGGIFPGNSRNYQQGMNLSLTLANLGFSPAGRILAARNLSRQALLQANQELLLVTKQVRAAYLGLLVARERVDASASAAAYAAEALRLARLRLSSGAGSNLELIEAQNDYIHSLSAQARAITAVNIAQAQLLHATGTISIKSLTRGNRFVPENLR